MEVSSELRVSLQITCLCVNQSQSSPVLELLLFPLCVHDEQPHLNTLLLSLLCCVLKMVNSQVVLGVSVNGYYLVQLFF